MSERNFFAELKRRNVYKVAVGYAVVGWLVMQVAATVCPGLASSGRHYQRGRFAYASRFSHRARAGLGIRDDSGRNQAHRGGWA